MMQSFLSQLFLWGVAITVLPQAMAFLPTLSASQSTRPSLSSVNMFTGIVEEMGTVVSLEEREDMLLWDGSKGKGTELVVQGDVVLEDAYLG